MAPTTPTAVGANSGANSSDTIQLSIGCGVTAYDLEVCQRLVAAFVESYPAAVNVTVRDIPDDPELYRALLELLIDSGSNDLDVIVLQPTWLGSLARHLRSLPEAEDMLPVLQAAGRIGKRQRAVPFAPSIGLLYYRTDLLAKYGYLRAPVTWSELEALAFEIQRGERTLGNTNFWGYVWAGATTTLTNSALEWLVAQGSAPLVGDNRDINLANPDAVRAMDYAQRWVGSIAPQAVLSQNQQGALELWLSGQVAFLHADSSAYTAILQSPLADRVGVARLPSGRSRSAAKVSGWYLGVRRRSLHPQVARDLVAFMTQATFERWRADVGYLPLRESSYQDPIILEQRPYYRFVPAALESAVLAPVDTLGRDYAVINDVFAQGLHNILADKDVRPEQALAELEAQLRDLR
jgi:trehalose/maltose transport system substrate-binding protein